MTPGFLTRQVGGFTYMYIFFGFALRELVRFSRRLVCGNVLVMCGRRVGAVVVMFSTLQIN